MTITNGLVSLAEFKAYATVRGGTTVADSSDDAVIEDIIEQTSRYIEGETGRRFWKNSSDETRYFRARKPLRCDVDDLSAAPTSVSGDYSDTRSYTALSTTTDYELDPPNAALDGWPYTQIHILPTSSAYFPVTQRGVKVVGKFGFPSVPDDIKELCLAIALDCYQSRSGQSSPGNITTATTAGVVIRSRNIPDWGARVLAKYRKSL
jgi:hypothetical protein